MLNINGLDHGLEIFKALGSEMRMRIVSLLAEDHLLFNLIPSEDTRAKQVYETRIRVGHYNDYSVNAGCAWREKTRSSSS